MRKYIWIAALLILLGLAICVPLQVFSVEPVPPIVPTSGTFEKYGPRVDSLTFKVAGSVVTEHDMFVHGEIDVEDWSSPAERWEDWLADPEITMGNYSELSAIYFALNNARWPLGHGDQLPDEWNSFPENYMSNHDPDLWPTELGGTNETYYVDYNCTRCLDARWFRRALSHLWNSEGQITYMMGSGAPLDSLIFPAIEENWELLPGIPTYPYDQEAAVKALENGGFEDWDDDGTIEYSPSHDGAVVEELPTLQFYTVPDDDHRIHAGLLLSDDMALLGIPHDLIIGSRPTIILQVWMYYDYDIYVDYLHWWAPLPDIYYELFHSRKDWSPDPWSDNKIRYHSLEFDAAADAFLSAPTAAEAKPYCHEMQVIIAEDAVVIPAYTCVGYVAHRTNYGSFYGEEKYAGKKWEGFVNEMGVGFQSFWTYLNAHPQGLEKGGTLRQGLIFDPQLLDIMDSIFPEEQLVLDRIYENLMKFNPYDPSQFIPWLCKNYTVGTWEHPTEGTCSAINFTIIPGILWQDGKPMTAEDVGFSFWFTRECTSVNYMYVKDFDSYEIYPDTPRSGIETIEIRFKFRSWLATYWCSGVPIIPKHVWSDEYARYCPVHKVYEGGPGVVGSGPWDPEDHDAVFGTGPFRFYKDNVVGRVDRVPGTYVYLEPNPLYFRKYIWPDVCDATHTPSVLDEWVDIDDFSEVAKPDNLFEDMNTDGTWNIAWGAHCDVNKDGHIGVDDLMEIGTHWNAPWPPEWYMVC